MKIEKFIKIVLWLLKFIKSIYFIINIIEFLIDWIL